MDTDQQKLRDIVNDDADGFLYHYTSLEVLNCIVSKKTIWAGHIRYLNDTSEQAILIESILSEMSRRASEVGDITPEHLDQWIVLFGRDVDPYCVICFSEDRGDRLSQWRAYGGNSGVCLKFRKAALQAFCRAQDSNRAIALKKVTYVTPEGDDHLRAQVQNILKELDETASDITIPVAISIEGAILKHEAFREEKEWRLLVSPDNRVWKYRVRGSLLVPYVELDLKDHLSSLLEGVIVGPINYKEQTAEAIRGLLQDNGLTSVEVRSSETPYRGF